MIASMYSEDDIVAQLLARSEIAINVQDKDDMTALMHACKYEGWHNERIVEKLLAKEDIAVNLQSKNGKTALMLAILYSEFYLPGIFVQKSTYFYLS